MDKIPSTTIDESQKFATLLECLSEVEDPRKQGMISHKLPNVLAIIIIASIVGANDSVAVAQFAKRYESELRSILDLEHGVPSHDTIGRVLIFVNEHQLKFWVGLWKKEMFDLPEAEALALDGKVDKANKICLVRLFDTRNRTVIASESVGITTNEIPVATSILQKENLKNKLVTGDAAHTQRENASIIVSNGGDYLFAVKGNQGRLHKEIRSNIDDIINKGRADYDYDVYESWDTGHGRIEHRRIYATSSIESISQRHLWTGMQTMICLESTRTIGSKQEISIRLFMTSLGDHAEHLLKKIRGHWSIENHCHRSLDVEFDRDKSTLRDRYAAHNYATLTDLALWFIRFTYPERSLNDARAQFAYEFGVNKINPIAMG